MNVIPDGQCLKTDNSAAMKPNLLNVPRTPGELPQVSKLEMTQIKFSCYNLLWHFASSCMASVIMTVCQINSDTSLCTILNKKQNLCEINFIKELSI